MAHLLAPNARYVSLDFILILELVFAGHAMIPQLQIQTAKIAHLLMVQLLAPNVKYALMDSLSIVLMDSVMLVQAGVRHVMELHAFLVSILFISLAAVYVFAQSVIVLLVNVQ